MAKQADKSKRKPGSVNELHEQSRQAMQRNIRETIESVAIAFILAFLFRTFEAEAFVIPTGSMAPTLQGLHKDVACPKCGYRCRANASAEEGGGRGTEVVALTCPMCRYTMSVDPATGVPAQDPEVRGTDEPSYSGDRILVGKFVYEFGEPHRWDVIVFKYPGNATMNYIKRLIGLPNETVRIFHGDIFTKPTDADAGQYRIARKGRKLLPMLQVVHDNHYMPAELVRGRWPFRWQVWPPRPQKGGWTSTDTERGDNVVRVFKTDGTAPGTIWLRYQHLIPTFEDWKEMAQGPLPEGYEIRPRLITDFYAYNTSQSRGEQHQPGHSDGPNVQKTGLHWVGDLMVEATVQVQSSSGKIVLDLVEGGRHYQAHIDVASGQAELTIPDQTDAAPRGQTPVRGPGLYRIGLVNADDQLRLWVAGKEIEFDRPTTFDGPLDILPNEEDLAPAGVGSEQVVMEVTHLRVLRDIYYIADKDSIRGPITDYDPQAEPIWDLSRENLARFLSDPSRWGVFARRTSVEFPLEADQFFVLGDNSPFSKDSRLWPGDGLDYYVDRDLLIGKALFIYWPHSWDRVPGTPIPFPFFPNFQDMGLVR